MSRHDTHDEPKGITLEIPKELRSGKYANMVSVTIGQNEVVIDFAFMLPSNEPTAEVVQRVILSPHVAKSFLSAFQNAVLDYENQVSKNK